jgi:hypothetical protein
MPKKRTTRKRRATRRNSNDPMKLIGYGVKGVVGVTVLGVTSNALSEIGKH